MSYDINVFIPMLSNNLLPNWLKQLQEKSQLHCEFHPDFSFAEHSGVVPCKVQTSLPTLPIAYQNIDLFTSFDLFIYDSHHEFLQDIPEELLPKINEMLYELVISMSADNSLEFRLGWYAAATLTLTTDGVLYDPQTELYFNPTTVLKAAERIVAEFENCLESEDWRLHKFTGWE